MKRRIQRRNLTITLLAAGLLAIISVIFLPTLMGVFFVAPKLTGGLAMAGFLPVLCLSRDDAGSGSYDSFESKVLAGVETLQKRHSDQQEQIDELSSHVIALRKQGIRAGGRVTRGVPGEVSEDCARHLGAIVLLAGIKQGRLSGDAAAGLVKDILGVEAKTAVTSSDIPLPVGYSSEVVELVSQYGAARRYGTLFPLGAATVNLPRLKTSPAFGLIAASATVTEVVPATEYVAFTAQKFGGLVRLPSEIEEDGGVGLGQFLARYMARELARVEDHNYFIGTGANSGANGSVKGLCLSTIDNSKVYQMGSGKTKYSDVTLANLRALRSVVDTPALGQGAYYMHGSFEQALSGLNSSGDKPYEHNGMNGPTLDGFPIRWVDIMPAWSASANAGKVFALFGDLRYQYLGVRGGIRMDISDQAGFATDEILIRGLERFTIGLMATGAIGGLETAAA